MSYLTALQENIDHSNLHHDLQKAGCKTQNSSILHSCNHPQHHAETSISSKSWINWRTQKLRPNRFLATKIEGKQSSHDLVRLCDQLNSLARRLCMWGKRFRKESLRYDDSFYMKGRRTLQFLPLSKILRVNHHWEGETIPQREKVKEKD